MPLAVTHFCGGSHHLGLSKRDRQLRGEGSQYHGPQPWQDRTNSQVTIQGNYYPVRFLLSSSRGRSSCRALVYQMSTRFSAARLGIEVVYHRCLLQAASIFALRPCSLLECQGKIKNANYNLWTQTTVLGPRSVQVHLAPIFEEILFLPSHGIGYIVWDTRFSLLDWVRVAGLSCTKGVWYIYDWDTG